jgi:proteic killer suppression protein
VIQASKFKHRGLRELYNNGRSRRVPQDLLVRIRQRLDILEAMEDLTETAKVIQSLRIHQLTGKRRGTWSLRVSGPWRLTFRFRNGDVYALDLEQYH